jgi:MFS family permease
MDPQAANRPRLSHFRQAMMALFWFGIQAHWSAILLITLPKQAFIMGGDRAKGQTLGLILPTIAIVSMIVAPLFGALSDRIMTPLGRRRPWIIVGTLFNIVGLYGLASFPRENDLSSLALYIAAAVWVVFWNNVANAPYNALIPDLVAKEQRGSAAGWYGLMSMLGNAVGAATGIIFTRNGVTDLNAIYLAVAVLMFVSMLGTVSFTQEPRRTEKLPAFHLAEFLRSVLDPLRDHDFRWVFATRFLMVMGFFTVQEFLQFYFRDVVRDFSLFGNRVAENPEAAVSVFGLTLLLGAVASSLVAGVLSDRFGRKVMVYVSSALQAAVPLTFLFFTSFNLAVVMGIVFGLGYGAYQAVDWALASDVLPSETDNAKDMGVWHIAFTLPQLVLLPAGLLLDYLQAVGRRTGRGNLGYDVVFLIAAVCFVLGTVLVRKIRKVK